MSEAKEAKANILLIDDEKLVRKAVGLRLKRLDYNVFDAESGSEGLDMITEHSIDMVVSDIMMPEMDGIQVLKEIKVMNPHMPVVMLTGATDIETVIEAMKNGALDYILKPVDKDRLRMIVKNAIKHGELLKENERLLEELQNKQIKLETQDQLKTIMVNIIPRLLVSAPAEMKNMFIRIEKVYGCAR